MKVTKQEKIHRVLSHNVEGVIERAHLEQALNGGRRLRIKLGIDPTGSKIHIGRAVVLWKLREFQDLGHKAVLIVGDMTAQIGDPSDKLQKRPFLTAQEVKRNLKNYLAQMGKIVDLKKTEIHYNSKWLAKLNFREVTELAELFTFQQILERRNFKERFEHQQDISYREGMYALMQGYDSVAVRADVELGGTDQLFNLLAGRKIQQAYGQKPQDVMVTKMLSGTDGRKMSTSWGNVINITDEPDEQFGRIMAMRDEMMKEYFELAADLSEREIASYMRRAKESPKSAKENLALEIVKRYHGAREAKKAQERFEKMFSRKEIPDDVPELKLAGKKLSSAEAVLASGVVKSKSEAWRLVAQGGFSVNGVAHKDPKAEIVLKKGDVLKIGKRHFFRINK